MTDDLRVIKHIWSADLYVGLIENAISRTMRFYEAFNLANEVIGLCVAATVDNDLTLKLRQDAIGKLRKQGEVDGRRATYIVNRIIGDFTKHFEEAYGSNWRAVVAQCNIKVKTNTDLILEQVPAVANRRRG